MASLLPDRPRRNTRNGVSYVEPRLFPLKMGTSSTRGEKRGGRNGGQRGAKRPKPAKQDKMGEQGIDAPREEEDGQIEYDAPSAEKRRRRSLPLPKGTQVEWNNVSREYLGQTFPTLAACLPEISDPTNKRADVLAAVSSCIEKKLGQIKTINEEILDAKAAIRFLEQQVVESEIKASQDIKQEPKDEEDLPVSSETIEPAPVECPLSPSAYAMFAYERSPQKVILMKTEPLEKIDDFSHASLFLAQEEMPKNFSSPAAQMEEPTVEIHSEERPINENEKETIEAVSEVRDKTMTQDDSPIQPYRRSSTSTEPQRPRRFASPVNLPPTRQRPNCRLPNSWRNGQQHIIEPSNYEVRERDSSFGRIGYEELHRTQYPAPLYFHQQPQRRALPSSRNAFGSSTYYYHPPPRPVLFSMDYNTNNRPRRRGRGGYPNRNFDNRRIRSPERPYEKRDRRDSWSPRR